MIPGCGSHASSLPHSHFLTHTHTHANTFLNQTVLDGDQGRMWWLACAAGRRKRREGGLSTPTSSPAATAAAAVPAAGACTRSSAAVCSERPALIRRRRGEGTEKDRTRVAAGGGEEAKKEEKKERGMAKEDRGPLAADAVDLLLCSIHGVMADSSWSSLSQNSCQEWACPLQVVRRRSLQQRAPF